MAVSAVDAPFWDQCTYYVAQALSWVPGTSWGNAGQWIQSARNQGFQVTQTPTVGSVVEYAPGGGYSSYGHVGVVRGVNPNGTFQVQEQNYNGPGQVDIRTSTMADVAGFILGPGQSPGAGGVGASNVGGASTNATLAGNPLTDIATTLVPGLAVGEEWVAFIAWITNPDTIIRAALIVFGGLMLLEGFRILFASGASSSTTVVTPAPSDQTSTGMKRGRSSSSSEGDAEEGAEVAAA
jgi:CHAP domain